jgi:hypothetical protein
MAWLQLANAAYLVLLAALISGCIWAAWGIDRWR